MSFAALHKTSSRKIYLKECDFGCEGKITLYFNLFLLFDKRYLNFTKKCAKKLNYIKWSHHELSESLHSYQTINFHRAMMGHNEKLILFRNKICISGTLTWGDGDHADPHWCKVSSNRKCHTHNPTFRCRVCSLTHLKKKTTKHITNPAVSYIYKFSEIKYTSVKKFGVRVVLFTPRFFLC